MRKMLPVKSIGIFLPKPKENTPVERRGILAKGLPERKKLARLYTQVGLRSHRTIEEKDLLVLYAWV
ncbi:MAG: hypothetical protein K940chlam2_00420 [Chlamydiae bacterium]|nr:hypothetical protein [Chlamydiota bacterium]